MKILIVGAGFSGAVIARELAEQGHEIRIIDQRDHIVGNAYDKTDANGIRVHVYGPHLFHTKNKEVFEWLSKFTQWVPYQHKVKALLNDGRFATLPVNRETKELVGAENVIEIFIRPYSEKMWGMKLEELDPQILNRVPIRDDENELYFPEDDYQYMPANGFEVLFRSILEHDNITIELNTPFKKEMEMGFDFIFNSMPIDEYYDYCLGELPYRSIKFTHVTLPAPYILPVTVVNFTHTGKYTRITEWKHIPNHGVNDAFTTLTYEEPCDYKENQRQRFYPVKDISGINKEMYRKYANIPNKKVVFIGRLGQYVYLDMDQCVSSALSISKKFTIKYCS